MPDSCYLAKYVSYLWPTVAADRTRRLSLQDAPCWPCNTPQAEELFLLLSGDTISGATRKAVGEYMVRHSFFEENDSCGSQSAEALINFGTAETGQTGALPGSFRSRRAGLTTGLPADSYFLGLGRRV